jgi:cysteinyl-tRNA synthetase
LIEGADALLGLSLISPPEETAALDINTLPADIRKKVEKREEARMEKDFATADALREEIIRGGYHVDDGPMGPILTRRDE